MSPVTVSAPGKVFLMGEHAVVYGYPALLAAVNLRTTVTLTAPASPDTGVTVVSQAGETHVRHALEQVRSHLGLDTLPPMHIHVSSDIPTGYHLGSSAAVAVATIGAALYAIKRIWNPELTNRLAYETEKKQHTNPSGADNTACTFGGLVWYRKELEFLKSMWQLPLTIKPVQQRFRLLDSGKPTETTGQMVQLVATLSSRSPKRFQTLFCRNERAVRQVAAALRDNDESRFMASVREGERTLERMGVVGKTATRIIRSVEHIGGCAKVLGGGGRNSGSGYILAYHPKVEDLEALAKSKGYGWRSVAIGEEGARIVGK